MTFNDNASVVSIDPTFFAMLQSQFGGSAGSLAQLYVLAHEYTHHVQKDENGITYLKPRMKAQIPDALSAAHAVGDDHCTCDTFSVAGRSL